MAQVSELMAAGMHAALANMLGVDPLTHVTPTGSNQSGAAALVSSNSILDSASTAGVLLPPASAQDIYVVYNNSGNAQNVYPTGTETINSSSGGSAFSVTSAKACLFIPSGKTWIAVLSA